MCNLSVLLEIAPQYDEDNTYITRAYSQHVAAGIVLAIAWSYFRDARNIRWQSRLLYSVPHPPLTQNEPQPMGMTTKTGNFSLFHVSLENDAKYYDSNLRSPRLLGFKKRQYYFQYNIENIYTLHIRQLTLEVNGWALLPLEGVSWS